MGASGNLESKNDHLIDELLEDPNYKIKDGKIFTKLTLNGQGISDEWREVGYQKADGYVRFRYKGEFLFAQRVIYQYENGDLQSDMVINHIDLDNSNNNPPNLEQLTQHENNKKKHKKYKKSVLKKVKGNLMSNELIERIIDAHRLSKTNYNEKPFTYGGFRGYVWTNDGKKWGYNASRDHKKILDGGMDIFNSPTEAILDARKEIDKWIKEFGDPSDPKNNKKLKVSAEEISDTEQLAQALKDGRGGWETYSNWLSWKITKALKGVQGIAVAKAHATGSGADLEVIIKVPDENKKNKTQRYVINIEPKE